VHAKKSRKEEQREQEKKNKEKGEKRKKDRCFCLRCVTSFFAAVCFSLFLRLLRVFHSRRCLPGFCRLKERVFVTSHGKKREEGEEEQQRCFARVRVFFFLIFLHFFL
jgi:hypothetical protein